ncbi:MAG: oligoribonuclease [Bdellovibrio sp.]|nr:MAG: oligoribonuclease [Bdellovibrio sp.]
MDALLWLDLEMTGLDVQKEVIIEVGAIVTDIHLQELESYQAVVKQPSSYLENMDDWNQKQHRKSGLLELIPKGKNQRTVEDELLSLTQQHFSGKPVVLAGNSIGQDRLFIKKYMPRLEEKLHYRMLDVSSWKVIFNNVFKKEYKKSHSNHRALEDIKESINELKFYLQFVNIPKPSLTS